MKHIIIGTAGHVDHGKTCLIRALTGIDTDRLEEEKKRGITIELGFANLTLDDGTVAGIVDVPGHEKFIRNMLMGAGGVDLALLVVAADEGFMPQTREHLSILSLLGIGRGVIAVTKTDLVDAEWLAAVQEEIRDEVKGSFLEEAPMVAVSSSTGAGIPELRRELTEMAASVEEKNSLIPFRLPIDRVFSIDGFGTVVTGTLIEGKVGVGDAVTVYPIGVQTRVRNLQVHGADVPEAFAGQRVAMNLAGLSKADLDRGETVAAEGSMEPTALLDVRLEIVPECRRKIENGTRLHFFHGSGSTLCRLTLLDADGLSSGQSGLAQLRLDRPVACKDGDRFVVRFYSPLETVGGGRILESHPAQHRRRDAAVLSVLEGREKGTPRERLELLLQTNSGAWWSAEQYAAKLNLSAAETEALFAELPQAVKAGGLWLHAAFLAELRDRAEKLLDAYHAANPLLPGMKAEEFRSKLLGPNCPDVDAVTAAFFAAQEEVKLENGVVKRADFVVYYTQPQQRLHDALAQLYEKAGFAPPDTDSLPALFPKEKGELKKMLGAMLDSGELVLVCPQFNLGGKKTEEARRALRALQDAKGSIALPDFRDALGTSRKFALPLLEYFDRRGVTLKNGDLRTLREA